VLHHQPDDASETPAADVADDVRSGGDHSPST
jgi:hypothetical protein